MQLVIQPSGPHWSLCDCHHHKLSDPALGSGRCPGTGWVCGRTTTKMTTTIPNPRALIQATPSRHPLRGSICSTGETSRGNGHGCSRGCLVMCWGCLRDWNGMLDACMCVRLGGEGYTHCFYLEPYQRCGRQWWKHGLLLWKTAKCCQHGKPSSR